MANHIDFRWVHVREPSPGGGFVTTETKLQFRTKNITSPILGVVPLSSAWSEWQDVSISAVMQDANGNPSQ